MNTLQSQLAFMNAQAEIRKQISQELTVTKQVLQSIGSSESDNSTFSISSCPKTEITEACDIESSVEEVSLVSTVPVFQSINSGEMFQNKPSREDKMKNKILKPIQEEDVDKSSCDRQ
jgi:hypothetical protein